MGLEKISRKLLTMQGTFLHRIVIITRRDILERFLEKCRGSTSNLVATRLTETGQNNEFLNQLVVKFKGVTTAVQLRSGLCLS